VVIRQKAQRVPTGPIVLLMVILAVVALALAAGSASKSTPASRTVVSPTVTTSNAPGNGPDALDRNSQILQSKGPQHSKAIYHFQ
jgi:ABC-type glycerol-3-phosphate transport system substrate-binding protein